MVLETDYTSQVFDMEVQITKQKQSDSTRMIKDIPVQDPQCHVPNSGIQLSDHNGSHTRSSFKPVGSKQAAG